MARKKKQQAPEFRRRLFKPGARIDTSSESTEQRLTRFIPFDAGTWGWFGLISFAIAVWLPFMQIGDDDPRRGFQCLAMGWTAVTTGGISSKVLFIAWASNFLLLKSLSSRYTHLHQSNPFLYLVLFLIAGYSVYSLTSMGFETPEATIPIQVMEGAYFWVGAFFCGYIANAKSVFW